jgi:hemin uptake protein HemP
MVLDSKDNTRAGSVNSGTRQVNVVNGELDSQELFQTERELLIRHGGMVYRLRLTGLNKLILTK